MNIKAILVLFIVSLFLVGCSSTSVVKKIDNTVKTNTTQSNNTNQTTGATITTTGKTPVKCDDTDDMDYGVIGKVTVTYSDKSTESFYDDCPGKELGNDMIEKEYYCDGNQPKFRNNICPKFTVCTMINVKADPGKKVGACY